MNSPAMILTVWQHCAICDKLFDSPGGYALESLWEGLPLEEAIAYEIPIPLRPICPDCQAHAKWAYGSGPDTLAGN